ALSRRLSSKKLISKETTIEKIKKQHEDSVIVRTVIPLNDVDKKLISKETTIEKIKKRHEDSVILGTVIPLNDLSNGRIKLPCKSINCEHIQCFDILPF
ncbi:6507_t:CDS:2, partial [Entrophospora sp. SA101]